MKIFLFLLGFYVSLIVYGVSTADARQPDDGKSTTMTISEQLADEDTSKKLVEFIDQVEAKVGTGKIQEIIQAAADKNPQVAELLAMLQEYGVLTDITLDTSQLKSSKDK